MSIAPIVRTVQVKAPPARAFAMFAEHIQKWWPKGIGKAPHVAIVIEPHDGGRWFERDAEGVETQWGVVLAWEPPARMLLGWQINSRWSHDPDCQTEVELTFAPAAGGGTLVTLEHRHLERLGADAAATAERLGGGWAARLADLARYADAHS
jgi:uncharacterized protein YndB with AHSA1/START domain